jgi:hypothetical protein
MEAVIRVDGLSVSYRDSDRWLRVLHDVGFAIGRAKSSASSASRAAASPP